MNYTELETVPDIIATIEESLACYVRIHRCLPEHVRLTKEEYLAYCEQRKTRKPHVKYLGEDIVYPNVNIGVMV